MATYRIICTNQVPVDEPTTHAHIVAVGTGDDPEAPPTKRWTLQEVIDAIEDGDDFYTEDSEGNRADVDVIACPACDHEIIRTGPDDSTDNNLDSLPICAPAGGTTSTAVTSTERLGNPPATPRLPQGRNVG